MRAFALRSRIDRREKAKDRQFKDGSECVKVGEADLLLRMNER
jgi:hypothetical protein